MGLESESVGISGNIDNMMNLEMLMWASKNSDNPKFAEIAKSHADVTMKHHFRPDYSSYHVISYDTISGQPESKNTCQGYAHESCWARGQGWALYGYTMMYRETGQEKYLQHATNVARFYYESSSFCLKIKFHIGILMLLVFPMNFVMLLRSINGLGFHRT